MNEKQISMLKKYKKMLLQMKELEALLALHKIHLNSIDQWERYRKEHAQIKLPSTVSIYAHFGSWNQMKAHFDLPILKGGRRRREFHKEDVLKMLSTYESCLLAVSDWDFFVRNNRQLQLPNSRDLIKLFKGWNQMKAELGYWRHEKGLISQEGV